MNRIIDLWQSATGDRVKDRPAGQPAQPVRLPTPTGAPTATPPAAPTTTRSAPAPVLAAMNGSS